MLGCRKEVKAVSSQWGRDETYRWPSAKPVWTIAALVVAVAATIGTAVYEYKQQWTFFQRLYLTKYINTVARPWLKSAPYDLVYVVEAKGQWQRRATDKDLTDAAIAPWPLPRTPDRKAHSSATAEIGRASCRERV